MTEPPTPDGFDSITKSGTGSIVYSGETPSGSLTFTVVSDGIEEQVRRFVAALGLPPGTVLWYDPDDMVYRIHSEDEWRPIPDASQPLIPRIWQQPGGFGD